MNTKPLIIKNARIIDPQSEQDFTGAVLVENGRIADVVEGALPGAPENADRVDAKGKVLAPGLIDTRVFTGEPGREYRETLKSASNAALAGGVTSFVCMPDTKPIIDEAALVDFLSRRANATAKAKILPSAALTRGLEGAEVAEYGLLQEAGAVLLTDGRNSLSDTGVIRSAFSYAANFDMPVANHLAEPGLSGGVMHEGTFATTLGLPGIPVEAESIPLERDLQLARLTGVRYHAFQISSDLSCRIMAVHKGHNDNVTAGVSINNLTLNENDIGSYRTFFKLSPPLRSDLDRQAVVEALKNGVIDIIHSDHDPKDVEVKRQPFADASNGAIGLETLLAAALRLVHSGDVPLMTVLKAMTINPAKLLRLETGRIAKGAPADMILIDLDRPWVVDEHKLRSRSRNTVFERALMTGYVANTYVNGEDVFTRKED